MGVRFINKTCNRLLYGCLPKFIGQLQDSFQFCLIDVSLLSVLNNGKEEANQHKWLIVMV